uniref:THAP domain-containing protein 1 n=1 Tax=Oryzias latipes TaxID=8090 RepID=A0A3P9LUP1_ORYLA
MVHTCVAVGCHNRKTPDSRLSFYRFPRDKDRKQRWIAAVKRAVWQSTDASRLCSEHFVSGKQSKNQFSPDYIPSVFKHTPSPEKRKHLAELANFEWRQELIRSKRQEQEKRTDVAAALLELQSIHPVNSATTDAVSDAQDQNPVVEHLHLTVAISNLTMQWNATPSDLK